MNVNVDDDARQGVSPITGCMILQINCEYYVCIPYITTSLLTGDCKDEHLQIRKS